MKRITERDKDGIAAIPYWFKSVNENFEEKVAEKLAQYEDLEEKGFLSEAALSELNKADESYRTKSLNLSITRLISQLGEIRNKLKEIMSTIDKGC